MGSDPDLKPGDDNRSALVSAQALLMENYTTPSQPVPHGSFRCTSYAPVDGSAPQAHIFIGDTDDDKTVRHYQEDPASFTGWTGEDIGLNGSKTKQLVAGYDEKGLVLFCLSTSLEVSYMRAIPVNKKGKVTFLPMTWTTIGAFPTDHSSHSTTQVLSLATDMKLYAGWERTDTSSEDLVWQIDWSKTKDNWSQLKMDHSHKYFYAMQGGDDSLYVSVSDSDGDNFYINRYEDKSWTTIWEDSKYKSKQLEVTTLPQQKNCHGVYSRDSSNTLQWHSYNSSTKKTTSTELMKMHVETFTVVQGETSEFEKIIAVTTDNLLYSVSYNGTDFSDPIQVGAAASDIIGASFPGDTNHAALFYAHTSGNLVEMTQSSDDAFHRTHVCVEPDETFKDPSESSGIAAGYHYGSPELFSMSGSKIFRYTVNSKADLLQHLWTKNDADFPDNHTPASICNTTDGSGRIVLFCEDDKGEVWVRTFGVPQGWQSLGNGPSGGISKVFSAGLVNDVVTLMSVVTFTSETKVYNVIVTAGDDFGKWKQATSNDHGSATSVSVGRTSFADGFFTNSKNGGIYFYELGTQTSKQTYKAGTKYDTVYATPTSTDEVIAESQHTLHYVTVFEDVRISYRTFNNGRLSMYYNTAGQLVFLDSDYGDSYYIYRITMTSPGIFSTDTTAATSCIAAVGLSDDVVFGRDNDTYPSQFKLKNQSDKVPTYTVPRLQQKTGDNNERPLTTFASWNINFMVTDKNGAGVANTKVSYKPVEDDVVLRVNGKLVSIGQSDPEMVAYTNVRGAVNVMSVADSLHCPVFEVWTDLHTDLDNEATSVLEPNNEEQLYLGKVTLEELQDATTHDLKGDGKREKLFPSDQEGLDNDFVLGLHATVNAGKHSTDITNAYDLSSITSRNSRGTILHSTTHARAHEIRRLDPETCAKTSFRIKYLRNAEGKRSVKYESLPPNVISEIIDDMDGEPYTGTYGELMLSANSGFVDVQETAFVGEDVTKPSGKKGFFKKALKAAVSFVVDGVKKVWKGVIEFVEDVMSAAQSLFAHLGVLFKQMFEWLGSFFGWKDILNTSNLIETYVKTFMENGDDIFEDMGKRFDGCIDTLKEKYGSGLPDDYPDGMSEAMRQTGDDGMTQANEVNQEVGDPGRSEEDKNKTVYGTDPQATWLTDVFTGVAPTMEDSDVFEANESLVSLMNQMKSGTSDAMTAAGEGQADNQQDMCEQVDKDGTSVSLSDFLGNLKAFFVDAALDGTKAAGDCFFSLGGKMVTQVLTIITRKIKIPIISTLWKTVITDGDDLTLLNLFSLLGAVPATLAYKLMCFVKTKKIYAPVVAKTKDIKNSTYQIALDAVSDQLSGLPKAMATRTKGDDHDTDSTDSEDSDEKTVKIASFVFGTVYSVNYGLMGIFDSMNASTPTIRTPSINMVSKVVGWMNTVNTLISIIVSWPSWISKYPIWKGLNQNPQATAEELAWLFTWPFWIADLFPSNPAEPDAVAVARTTMVMFIWGCPHIATYVGVMIEDIKAIDWDDSDGWPKTSFGLKVAQNFLTSIGEASWGIRGAASLRLINPDAEPVTKTLAALTIIGWETVAFETPALLSLIRTAQDFAIWRTHRVAY